jgi:hypothetical protein
MAYNADEASTVSNFQRESSPPPRRRQHPRSEYAIAPRSFAREVMRGKTGGEEVVVVEEEEPART